MNRRTIFRALLALYPREFREQFSSEMFSVFEQKIDERAGSGANPGWAFICGEYFWLLKGATRMWVHTVQKVVQFKVGEHYRLRLERRASLVQKLVQFKSGEQMGHKYFLVSFPILGGWFPKPTAEEIAWSPQELQQRHSTARSAMFQAYANHDFAVARKHEVQAARFQSFLNRRDKAVDTPLDGDR